MSTEDKRLPRAPHIMPAEDVRTAFARIRAHEIDFKKGCSLFDDAVDALEAHVAALEQLCKQRREESHGNP